jgi:hypothetical protein
VQVILEDLEFREKIVTPVKTGVQKVLGFSFCWIPAFAGMTEKSLFRLLAKPSILKLGKLSFERHNVNNAQMQRAHPREIKK